jgi:tripartite-type tricarboxylate transporter receptor subunit TctC
MRKTMKIVTSLARTAAAGITLIATMLVSLSAAAAEFPSKPVRIIVPLSAGGPADTLARLMAPRLSERWKVPVLVENKPGAAGALGASALLNSPPDGHTLLLTVTTHIQAIGLKVKLSYDPIADFMPITQVAVVPLVLMVREDGPKTLAEFIAKAKADPVNVNYASFGPASTGHIYGELLNRVARLNVVNVPYAGGAPTVAAVLGGHATASFIEVTQARSYAKSGKLRPLAITGARRYSQMPDVQNFAELGYSGFELVGWHGVLVAKGTPKEVAARISADMREVMKEPGVQARFVDLGVDPVGSTPEEWGDVLKNDAAKWTSLIESTGVKSQ